MLLIDLLVKRGLWPKGYNFCAIDEDGTVDFYQYKPVMGTDETSWVDRVSEECDYKGGFVTTWFTGDWSNSVVTLEQYEAALKPVWDGKGVPPVGTECKMCGNGHRFAVTIVAVTKEYVIATEGKWESAFLIRDYTFQPVQTERDKFVEEVSEILKPSPVGVDVKLASVKLWNAGYRKV